MQTISNRKTRTKDVERNLHRPIVLATGVFDLLHPGHIRFLEASKKKAGRNSKLVVVVARDSTVHRRKGHNPILPEKERLKIVSSLRVVDHAMLGHPKIDLLGVLREVRPSLVSVGYDQEEIATAVKKVIKEFGLSIKVAQMPEFPGAINSSSKVKRQVLKKYLRS